jgi:hypothetical protein
MRNACKLFLGNLKGRDYFDHLDVGSRIILKWNLKKRGGRILTTFISTETRRELL